jgi:hypothetical protein
MDLLEPTSKRWNNYFWTSLVLVLENPGRDTLWTHPEVRVQAR